MKPTLPLGVLIDNPGKLGPRATLHACIEFLALVDAKASARHSAKPAAQHPDPLTKAQAHQIHRAIDALYSDLQRHVPPLTYWGYHPSNGALGVWIDTGALHQAEESGRLIQVADVKGAKPRRGLKAPYLLVLQSDGRATLVHRKDGREVWSIT